MKFEVIEQSGARIVRHNGVELARFSEQHGALTDIGERLRSLQPADSAVSLAVRYAPRPD